jgi:Tfp pilus assembly protein PilF
MGYCLWKSDAREMAIGPLTRALQLDPDFQPAHHNLALVERSLAIDNIIECAI